MSRIEGLKAFEPDAIQLVSRKVKNRELDSALLNFKASRATVRDPQMQTVRQKIYLLRRCDFQIKCSNS